MTEKDYKELNEYLNEMFVYFDKYYKFALDNMLDIFVVNDNYIKLINDYDLNSNFSENNLTYQDIYDCARKIIESINKDYLPLYDNLIETGQLDFSYNEEYNDSNFIYFKDIDLININREFNYTDVITLIHEFFHYTNRRYENNLNSEILTEFISIYFETYAINFLLKEGILKEEIGYMKRIKSVYGRAYDLYYVESPLLAYNHFGNLNEESYELLHKFQFMKLSKKQFINECKCLLKYFRLVKKRYQKEFNKIYPIEYQYIYSENFINHFKYFFGTLWAFYAIENCDMKDILYVNNHMHEENISLEDCMRIMKIEPDKYNTYEKAFESICNYIEKFNVKRK